MTIARFLLMCVGAAHSYNLNTPFEISKTSVSVDQISVDGNLNGFVLASDTVQFFDSDGTTQGDPQKVCSSGFGNIAVSKYLNYSVAAQAGYPNGIYARFFDANGVAFGYPFLVSSFDSNYRVSGPSVAANSAASLVAWAVPNFMDAGVESAVQVNLRSFSPLKGVPIRGTISTVFTRANMFDVKVSALPSASTTYTFIVCCIHDFTISAQMLNAQAMSLGNPFTINDGGAADNFAVATGPRASLVVWGITGGPLAGQVWGQYIGFDGQRLADNFRIASNNAVNPSVSVTVSGFQVAWSRNGWVYSQSFGANGGTTGSEFAVSPNFSNGFFPVVAAYPSNSVRSICLFVTGRRPDSIDCDYSNFFGMLVTTY
eukprot:TRINITY_DN81_c3_g1_i1.p1 TRINITY_DN81_c3_g1~~TRINITY_DN81_c3_g1_i1.p1  ORF type:complete len:372 (+),score=27.95 TRINITY_DN81_c3_g1_i1:73-1188(+)